MASILVWVYTFITIFLWKILKRKWSVIKKPLPPGPKPWPVIGCIPEMVQNKPVFHWIHKFMKEMETEIACFRLGNVHVIPITSPELGCEFLKKHDLVFSSRPLCMSAYMVANGFLTSAFLPKGDQWVKMRRILVSHVLSPISLKGLHHKRDQVSDHLLRFVYNQSDHDDINLRKVSRYYSWKVIRNMIFGTTNNEEEIEEQMDALFKLLEYLHNFSISDYLPWLSVFDLDGHKAILKKAFDTVTKHIYPEVDRRIQIWKDGTKTTKEDILDVLIMLKDTNGNSLLNAKEIKAQVVELMLATVDNPSTAVEWILAEMLNQPKLMQRGLYELDTVVGRNRLVQESDLPQLNYLKACIKEAFRLHPIRAFNIPHESTSDTIVGEFFIPKGSLVLLSRLGLGRNPRVWEEPMKFNPERHIHNKDSEVVLADPELRLLSFSTGRRGCPGVKLGSTITIMLLARLLQGFTWSLTPNFPSINGLVELGPDIFCVDPFFARAKPRLNTGLYP